MNPVMKSFADHADGLWRTGRPDDLRRQSLPFDEGGAHRHSAVLHSPGPRPHAARRGISLEIPREEKREEGLSRITKLGIPRTHLRISGPGMKFRATRKGWSVRK